MIKNNQKLEKLRKEIDLLDRKIAALIGKRFSVADKIGKLKKKNKMKIENKGREKIVLTKVKKSVKINKQKKAMSNIYKEMIKQTKQLEK
jgi:chorismate mutase